VLSFLRKAGHDIDPSGPLHVPEHGFMEALAQCDRQSEVPWGYGKVPDINHTSKEAPRESPWELFLARMASARACSMFDRLPPYLAISSNPRHLDSRYHRSSGSSNKLSPPVLKAYSDGPSFAWSTRDLKGIRRTSSTYGGESTHVNPHWESSLGSTPKDGPDRSNT
jgi:hypothetical protein